ncbi:MAG: hypothetical protein AMXMBFR49_01110 [Chlorobiota bacterium]
MERDQVAQKEELEYTEGEKKGCKIFIFSKNYPVEGYCRIIGQTGQCWKQVNIGYFVTKEISAACTLRGKTRITLSTDGAVDEGLIHFIKN